MKNNSFAISSQDTSDVERIPKKVQAVLSEAATSLLDKSPPRTRTTRRRMKRPGLRGNSLPPDTDEDFGRLISKKMHLLPFAIRCGLEVDILRMVNGALNSIDKL